MNFAVCGFSGVGRSECGGRGADGCCGQVRLFNHHVRNICPRQDLTRKIGWRNGWLFTIGRREGFPFDRHGSVSSRDAVGGWDGLLFDTHRTIGGWDRLLFDRLVSEHRSISWWDRLLFDEHCSIVMRGSTVFVDRNILLFDRLFSEDCSIGRWDRLLVDEHWSIVKSGGTVFEDRNVLLFDRLFSEDCSIGWWDRLLVDEHGGTVFEDRNVLRC
jgi:hypothetical protein